MSEKSIPPQKAGLVKRAKTSYWNSADLAGACSGGKFVVANSCQRKVEMSGFWPGDGWYMQMGLGAHPCPSPLRSFIRRFSGEGNERVMH